MLSWEYPPKVIGGLARAVADLSQALVEEGHEVSVVTGDWPESEQTEYVHGVRVYRVNQFFPKPMGFLDEDHCCMPFKSRWSVRFMLQNGDATMVCTMICSDTSVI